jgi:integrase
MIDERIKRSKSGYLFENPVTGNPFNGIKKAWSSILKDAGIEDFRFHDNRHTFGTYANLASNDLKGVSEVIGHSTVAQTSKYVHTASAKKVEIITLVNDLISAMIEKK